MRAVPPGKPDRAGSAGPPGKWSGCSGGYAASNEGMTAFHGTGGVASGAKGRNSSSSWASTGKASRIWCA